MLWGTSATAAWDGLRAFRWMPVESSAPAEEISGAHIEDLDLATRHCPVMMMGTRPKVRRDGAARVDFALETIRWDAGAAQPAQAAQRPVSTAPRRPGSGKHSRPGTCARTLT
ncbi:hypothetical protein O3Q52_24125 [Streptomyces sp. ActVer]|uniref:hypothetical protein n=1 Tax=Streptomyces sp. ActVer TaxID=3014558 RepID=UPI0022B38121|nr:hypothetical protein [Streptomyces sp. ActVer]MCZ4511217.1 hypothetical protein [Streptomyces sp. ActVer]